LQEKRNGGQKKNRWTKKSAKKNRFFFFLGSDSDGDNDGEFFCEDEFHFLGSDSDGDNDGEFFCEDMFSEVYDDEEFFLFTVQLHEVVGGDKGVSSASSTQAQNLQTRDSLNQSIIVSKFNTNSTVTNNNASNKSTVTNTSVGMSKSSASKVEADPSRKPVIKTLDKNQIQKAAAKNSMKRAGPGPQKKAAKTKKIAPFVTKVYKYAGWRAKVL